MSDLRELSHRNRSSRGARLGEWLALLTVVLGVIGMAMSSPALVGPDEPAHQATASYLTVHVLPPQAETQEYVAGILKHGACMAGKSDQDASCEPSRDDISAAQVRIMNYPPPYYWVVGLGQKFAPEADAWMDVGGRVASLLLNLAGLLLLTFLVRRSSANWGTALLVVTTPMAAFLWAVVNPSGWEVTTGLLFTYAFARAWWNSRDLGELRVGAVGLAVIAVTSIVFALSRHDAIIWMILLVLAMVLMCPSLRSHGERVKILAMTALGLVAGVAWQLFAPAQHVDNNPDRIASPMLGDYLHWFNQIDDFLPVRVRQMVGVLGWLDTPVPQILVLMLVVGWGVLIGLLYARGRIPLLSLVVGFLGIAVVPSLFEVLRWNDWPYWYQGRITLPFAIPFLYILVLRFGRFGPRAVSLLSIVSGGVLAFMVWQNLMRYAFGVRDYIPLRWSDPAVGQPWFGLTLLAVLLMLCAIVARAVFLVSGNRGRNRG